MRATTFVLLLCAVAAAGCLQPRPDPSRFFTLTSIDPGTADTERTPLRQPSVGLGPVRLPEYLDRPQAPTRVAPNELRFSETDRWAEPLASNFVRVLSQDLVLLLATDSVATFPWPLQYAPAYGVAVTVLRFDRTPDGHVVLVARWTISGPHRRVLDSRDGTWTEAAGSTGTEAAVAAWSRAVGDLARDVAADVQQIDAGAG
jgi:uncharacterized lipoprotein YmbA